MVSACEDCDNVPHQIPTLAEFNEMKDILRVLTGSPKVRNNRCVHIHMDKKYTANKSVSDRFCLSLSEINFTAQMQTIAITTSSMTE